MILRMALLVVLAVSLGGCAILAGAVIGGVIEHEYDRGQQYNGVYGWNGPPYPMVRYREAPRRVQNYRTGTGRRDRRER